jgi:hypothetical protein
LQSVPYAVHAQNAGFANAAGGGPSLEIRPGPTPFIDFANDNTSDFDARIILLDDNTLLFEGASMIFPNLGIGTFSPTAPIDVQASSNFSGIDYGFLQYTGGVANIGQTGPPNAPDISINVSHLMKANAYVAVSDERVKDIAGLSNIEADLEIINQLKVTDYNYKDIVSKGQGLHKGFIAQEVKQFIPGAVTETTDYIPNIYTMAESVTKAEDGDMIIRISTSHELSEGDEVRLFANTKGAKDCMVDEVIDDNTFKVCGLDEDSEQVFVFGKKVDDFLAVDYDRIFVSGIGAIQELSKQLEYLKAENEALKAQNALFKADIGLIKTQLGLDINVKK